MNYDPKQLPQTHSNDYAGYDRNAGSKYLAHLRLYTGTANAIATGMIGAGHFGAERRKDSISDLGTSINVIPFAIKDMALDTSQTGKPVRSFDAQSELFKDIQKKAASDGTSFKFGTVFLMFEQSLGEWLDFFCAPPSWRDEVSDALRGFLGNEERGPKGVTLSSKLVGTARKWYMPVVTECTTPFVNAPDLDAVIREVNKFLYPPEAEKVAEGTTRAR